MIDILFIAGGIGLVWFIASIGKFCSNIGEMSFDDEEQGGDTW